MIILYTILLLSNPLAIFIAFIAMVKDHQHSKRYVIVLAAGLAVFAYNYNPIGHPDLTRYFVLIENAKALSLLEYFEYMGDHLFVINTAFWIAGKMDMPHLIPAISTFIVYAVTFYITSDSVTESDNARYVWKTILIQSLCLDFASIINNVRNVCAFSIIILAVYMDIVKNKRNASTWVLYILACFIHESGIILLVARLLLYLVKRKVAIAAVLAVITPIIINGLFPYYLVFAGYGSIGKIISNLILTSYRAMNSTSRWAMTVMSSSRYLADRYFSIGFCLILLIAIFSLLKQKRETKFIIFLALLCLLTISCNTFRTPAYWRLFSASICCGGPLLNQLMTEKVIMRINSFFIRLTIFGMTGMLLLIHMYGSLTEINYFDLLSETLLNPLAVIIFHRVTALF